MKRIKAICVITVLAALMAFLVSCGNAPELAEPEDAAEADFWPDNQVSDKISKPKALATVDEYSGEDAQKEPGIECAGLLVFCFFYLTLQLLSILL